MLDKKLLRQFAAEHPAPSIPANHGLLHAPQVDHVIRTAIRIIGRRRTLVLYVYDRKRAAGGDPSPVWTMFQAGDDYITLAVQEDGSTRWREAAFERLGSRYCFTGKCAFYSVQDEQRVRGFFHDHNHGGMAALTRAQKAILDRRAHERQLRREKKTIDRMRPIRALPRGLNGWIRREVMPAYFRCEHASAKKPVTGICTSCGKESTLPHAAHNSKIACPRCGRELTVKSAGKTGRHVDRDTVQVVEGTGGAEVVARIVKVYYSYDRDRLAPNEAIYENTRVFVRQDPDGKAVAEPYYYSYGKGTLTHWMPGERPVFSHYQYNFEADACGHVYCRNLPEALAGTPWEYCPVAAFYGHFREPMQIWPFLLAHLEHPRLEHLVKVGFFSLASDLAYGRVPDGLLDCSRNRTHRVLGVDASDVPFLRELDPDAITLRIFQGYAGLKDRRELLLWQIRADVKRDVPEMLSFGATPRKLMRYAEGQLASRAGARYRDAQAVLSEWRDYASMAAKLAGGGAFRLYPRDLAAAHDDAQARLKAEEDAAMRRAFVSAMSGVPDGLRYRRDGFLVVVPSVPDEVVAEGRALRTCVGSYVGRVADGQCLILFVRAADAPDVPLCTMEVRDGRVVQLRGQGNSDPPPDVRAFVDGYERRVLARLAA